MISSIRKKTSMLSAGLNLKPVTDLLWRLVSRRYYYLLTDFAPEITVKTGCFQQFPSEGSASCLFAFNMAWLTTRGVWTDIAITAKVSCSTWLVDDRMLDSHGRLNLQVTKKKKIPRQLPFKNWDPIIFEWVRNDYPLIVTTEWKSEPETKARICFPSNISTQLVPWRLIGIWRGWAEETVTESPTHRDMLR